MLFKNTERKIFSHIFNTDPEMIPTISRIYKIGAELNQNEFKTYSSVLVFYGVLVVLLYQFQNFEAWPILNSILAGFIAMNIFGSVIMLTMMLFDYVIGNYKLRVFRKIIAIYQTNLTENGGENYEQR